MNRFVPIFIMSFLAGSARWCAAQPAFPAAQVSGLMGGDGRVHYAMGYRGHAPVLAGCPQWGFGGPGTQLPTPLAGSSLYGPHWSNHPDTWTLPTSATGFYDLGSGAKVAVGVYIRSHMPGSQPDSYGETNQNDGWFRFRVLIPAGNTNSEFRFLLNLTNRIDGSTNYWFHTHRCWDWAGDAAGQTIFRPLTRIVDPSGATQQGWTWRNTISVDTPSQTGTAARVPERLFRITGLPTNLNHDVHLEVAQGLPYTIPDLEAFWTDVSKPQPAARRLLQRVDFLWPATSGYKGYMTGLSTFPADHMDAETNNTFFAILISNTQVQAPVVLITAGCHYEPPGLMVCEGLVKRILEREYWRTLTFVVIPVCNPDAFVWATTHVRPFGTAYTGAGLPAVPETPHEDGEFWWRNNHDDVEAVALRDFMQSVRARFGTNLVLHLDLHSDLCPHPQAWWSSDPGVEYRSGAPIYGMLWGTDEENLWKGTNFAARVDATPRLGPYFRDPANWRQLWPTSPGPDYDANVGAAIHCVFELDETCLYRDDAPDQSVLPGWLIDQPEAFKRCAGTDCYWVDGPIARKEYFHYFGEDIADAIEAQFSPASSPIISCTDTNWIVVRWERGILQQTTKLQGESTVWTDVLGAASPWCFPLSAGDVMFFRTKRPND